jgi:predicted PurR-regulated permease PerM
MSEFIATTFVALILTVILWNLMDAFHDPRDPLPRPTHAHTLAFFLAIGIAGAIAVYATVEGSYGAVWPFIITAYYVRHFWRIMSQDVR